MILSGQQSTLLNDFLQMIPVYLVSQVFQHRRKGSLIAVILKAADFFHYKELKWTISVSCLEFKRLLSDPHAFLWMLVVRNLWYLRAVFNWLSKVIAELLSFSFTALYDWFKKLAPLSQPIKYKTNTNHVLVARVFPRLAQVTCICFEFSLIHCVVYVCCDWPL